MLQCGDHENTTPVEAARLTRVARHCLGPEEVFRTGAQSDPPSPPDASFPGTGLCLSGLTVPCSPASPTPGRGQTASAPPRGTCRTSGVSAPRLTFPIRAAKVGPGELHPSTCLPGSGRAARSRHLPPRPHSSGQACARALVTGSLHAVTPASGDPAGGLFHILDT